MLCTLQDLINLDHEIAVFEGWEAPDDHVNEDSKSESAKQDDRGLYLHLRKR